MAESLNLFSEEGPPEEWEIVFINALSDELGVVGQAARKAGVHERTVMRRREESPRFEALYQAAQAAIDDALEYESLRRALEPNERPIFQRGKLVGVVREYDTKHLEWLLERRMPERYNLNRLDREKDIRDVVFRPMLGDQTPELEEPDS